MLLRERNRSKKEIKKVHEEMMMNKKIRGHLSKREIQVLTIAPQSWSHKIVDKFLVTLVLTILGKLG